MNQQRLLHDASFALALSIVEAFQHLILESEKAVAFDEVYQRCLAGIERFLIHSDRERQRINPINPSRN